MAPYPWWRPGQLPHQPLPSGSTAVNDSQVFSWSFEEYAIILNLSTLFGEVAMLAS